MKKHRRKIYSVLIVISIMVIGFLFYAADYYHANAESFAALMPSEAVSVTITENIISFQPKDPSDIGLIFYPGGKVEYSAYSPLLKALASNGINCFLVHMPINLAVLDIDKARDVISAHSEISTWYIGGHSLGGAMASKYASENSATLKGILLLGAYASSDLSDTSLNLLSIYGSEDNVLNKTKVENTKSNNPLNSVYYEIEGGNHSYFGNYGEQKGDGTANITPKEQQDIAIKEICDFIEQ
jgi:dienelactone hydrolase